MIVAEPIAAEDMLSAGPVRMAILTDEGDRLVQETGHIGRVGIMAGQAIASRNGGMDVLLRECGLVVAHKTEIRNRRGEGEGAFLLCVRGRMA
jgi:hypothetical protein